MSLATHTEHQADAAKRSEALTASFSPPADPAQWHKRKMLVFDLETTGANVHDDRIVTASILEIFGNPFSKDAVVVREWLVNPSKPSAPGAINVHGVTNEYAAEHGLEPKVAVEEIIALLHEEMLAGVPVLAFNGSFDFTILDREAKREGVAPIPEEDIILIDPLVIDYALKPFRKGSRKLVDILSHYGLSGDFDAHNSSADCLATAQLAYQMAQHYYGSSILLTPETLHSIEQNWKIKWAAGRNKWAAGQGRPPTYSSHLGVVPEEK